MLKADDPVVTALSHIQQPVTDGFSDTPVVAIKEFTPGGIQAFNAEWGFLPGYLNDRDAVQRFRYGFKDATGKFNPGYTTLNATFENLLLNKAGKPSMFAKAARERRCIVPVTGFYEWRHVARINKKTGKELKTTDAYPYFVHLKDEPYFFMAGVWQPWADRLTGETVDTLAICTTNANTLCAQVHNKKLRMPTILTRELAEIWVNPYLKDEEITEMAGWQISAEKMHAWTIDSKFKGSLTAEEFVDQPGCPALDGSCSVS